jgi:hypothetical protein
MSSDYNPNSIWTSKEKKYDYLGPDEVVFIKPSEKKKPVGGPSSSPGQGSDTKKMIIAIILGVAVLAFLGFMYYLLRPAPPQNVALSFSNPGQVLVGEPFALTVSYANNSQNTLKDAALSLSFPSGISLAGQPTSQRFAQKSLGDMQPGAAGSSTFNLILTGNPQSVAHVDAKLAYGVSASPSAQYEIDATANILVGQAAIGLAVNVPSSIFSGQNFDATVAYINNANHALDDVKIQMQYPSSFAFQKSSGTQPVAPGNTVWNLGQLVAGASGTFAITGNLVGQDRALYSITANALLAVQGQTYTVASPSANLAIAPSPLSITGALNGSPDYVTKAGDQLQYAFTYLNNSAIAFQNVQIVVTLTGAMVDFKTLQSNASFNSLTNTLTWYPANTPELALVAPGQSGTVTVTVGTKSTFPIRFFGDKNYVVKAHAKIQSATVPSGTTASSTVSVMDMQNKVGGAITLDSRGYFYELKSTGISNKGPYPPKINQPTTYTIHWRITDYATDAQNVTVAATLQSGTTCTGHTKVSIASSTLTCNPANGQVMWQIPFIAATTGVINPPAEAVFQVKNTPAVNQLGSVITILGPAALTATDVFTSSTLTATAPAIMTDLPDDTSINPLQSRQVTQ